jgi:hypothetical protein
MGRRPGHHADALTVFVLASTRFAERLVTRASPDERTFFDLLAALDGIVATGSSDDVRMAADMLRELSHHLEGTDLRCAAQWRGRCWSAATFAWICSRRLSAGECHGLETTD